MKGEIIMLMRECLLEIITLCKVGQYFNCQEIKDIQKLAETAIRNEERAREQAKMDRKARWENWEK